MILDDVLFAIILAGIGLSGAYLRAELVVHRRVTAVERRRELVRRELHCVRVAQPYAPFATRKRVRSGRECAAAAITRSRDACSNCGS